MLKSLVEASADALVVVTAVRNDRQDPVDLVPDQCGRITEVIMARTVFEPEGEQWDGSVQAVKDFILRDQRSQQRADRFHPRIPGDQSPATPACQRLEGPVRLESGQQMTERWELPLNDFTSARVLGEVGSRDSVIRSELVEARGPDEVEYLDVYAPGSPEAADARGSRALRVETPAAAVVTRSPDPVPDSLSPGQLYDRLIQDADLRAWIEAQPEDSWRHVALSRPYPELEDSQGRQVTMSLVTTGFERAAHVVAKPDGTGVMLEAPRQTDRTRAFARGPAVLPPGIRLIEEPEAPTPSGDVLVGKVVLPSGRIAVGEYLFEDEVLSITVPSGSYPAHATLVRRDGTSGAFAEDVALATLVLSDEPTARWEHAYVVAVDGGTTNFTSVEAREQLEDLLVDDEDAWWLVSDEIFDAMMAHDYIGVEWPIGEGLNIVRFASGYGDGGYPVFIGYDAQGQPTRVVVDFLLLHLDWPETD
ncbi:MAG TPA: DUF4241 domain-containing protein [Candidatus Limnocylindria bacterium]|nr:DUF4241 domain-containing protein [Candidatus Limnocylindria bacterium]